MLYLNRRFPSGIFRLRGLDFDLVLRKHKFNHVPSVLQWLVTTTNNIIYTIVHTKVASNIVPENVHCPYCSLWPENNRWKDWKWKVLLKVVCNIGSFCCFS